ncbi:MAG: type I-E CRISPR-associated protein Cas6/Cse3/CasE [Spirochaetes bacterium]|nr:type I-E CRISPR-associated protein Cas6/Cse3/CasE [Spirochaetota bacterium]MBU1079923.1 type I-E CRISPR-associated protein Cas6/Cse3/CasE [Spirochaetota bacterium]
MYLSRVILDLSNRASLAVAADAYEAHRFVFAAYVDAKAARPLYRVEAGLGGIAVIAQGLVEPDWERALRLSGARATVESKQIMKPRFDNGTRYRFKLVANAVKTIADAHGKTDGQGKPKSVRVPLIRDDQLRAWLDGQGKKAGFIVERATVEKREPIVARNGRAGNDIRLAATGFNGTIFVSDGDALWDAIGRGFGHGKGFGLGLLSVAPAVEGTV